MVSANFKATLQALGLYPLARSIFCQIHPKHRRDKQANKRFYSEIIARGDLCFDIGANVGQTIEALLHAGASIVAVEPNINCLPVLNYQFKDNPNVRIVKKAMGAMPGTAMLHFAGADSTASIREDWPFPNVNKVEVEVSTLDSLIAEFGIPQFIKVDVEGFELEVFKGLNQAIPLIYFEMHGREINLAMQILERLSKIGEIVGVRVANMNNSSWLIDDYISPDQLINKLGEPLPQSANIVVKMKA